VRSFKKKKKFFRIIWPEKFKFTWKLFDIVRYGFRFVKIIVLLGKVAPQKEIRVLNLKLSSHEKKIF
jgi:hypothetical protein